MENGVALLIEDGATYLKRIWIRAGLFFAHTLVRENSYCAKIRLREISQL